MSTTPTDTQTARLAQAVIAKATRFLVLPEAPLGTWGEMGDLGIATVRPDYSIVELLYGLHFRDFDVDWDTIVSTDDVIRVGLAAEPDTFPTDKRPDVDRALAAAIDWINEELRGGIGFA